MISLISGFANGDLSNLTGFFYAMKFFTQILAIILHIAYFALIIKSKTLKKNTLIYLHHANLVSFITCLHYAAYMSTLHPTYANKSVNKVLCEISVTIWSITRFLRNYSAFLIAVYQAIAVFKRIIFKNISRSRIKLIFPIFVTWLIAILFHLSTKFGFNIDFYYAYCYDGHSNNIRNFSAYFLVCLIIDTLLPMILVFLPYLLIYNKVMKLEKKSNDSLLTMHVANQTRTINRVINKVNIYRTNSFSRFLRTVKYRKICADQFFVMALFNFLGSIGIYTLNALTEFNIIDSYSNYYLLIGILHLAFQSFIPLSTIIRYPEIKQEMDSLERDIQRIRLTEHTWF